MIIKRTSLLSDKESERDLPITPEELARWEKGELAQRVWPHLSAGDREFIMTGITEAEWDEEFKEEE